MTSEIKKKIGQVPAVALLGARQVGKTTLAKTIAKCMDLMRQSSESLAGRISYLYMSGLNIIETGSESDTIQTFWVRGGFPESYLAADG